METPGSKLRRLVRPLWILLVVAVGILPAVHAAHHFDQTTSCQICHFARHGMPAVAKPVHTILPPEPTHVSLHSETPCVYSDHSGDRLIIRGPPISSVS
jgi:hypothetical protein